MPIPLVDVCIPTYEPKREHLSEALQSLLGQTLQEWQAVIRDDASAHADVRALAQPFLTDSRIRFVRGTERAGIGGNWNASVKQGNSPLVAFLFQDDLWAPRYLERAVEILRAHPSVGFVSLEHAYHFEGTMTNAPLYEGLREEKLREVPEGLHQGRTFLRWWIKRGLQPNVIGEPSFVVMRRSVMTAVGPFLNDMPQFLDVDYWTRLLTICDWYNCREELGSFRVHPSAASARNEETGQGLFDRLRCFEYLIDTLHGADRRTAIDARNRAVESMVEKFFGRVKKGGRVSTKGSGVLRSFCLRHPILIATLIVKHFVKRPRPV
jgi:glycosyltransferase involved in cell wall biosynthesis